MYHRLQIMNAALAACRDCGAEVGRDELAELDLDEDVQRLPGCPGPRKDVDVAAMSHAGRLEIVMQLISDRDPETGEPREPFITREEAMKILDGEEPIMQRGDGILQFPNGGMIQFEVGAAIEPRGEEARALLGFDPAETAGDEEPAKLEVTKIDTEHGAVTIRVLPGATAGRVFFLPPEIPKGVAAEIGRLQKEIDENMKKLVLPFFAGFDFARPDDEQPLLLTYPQLKRFEQLAATSAQAGQPQPTQQCPHNPWDFNYQADRCMRCGMTSGGIAKQASRASTPRPAARCLRCAQTLPDPDAVCNACGYCNGPCCVPSKRNVQTFAPRPSVAEELYPSKEEPAPAKAPDAEACICFMSRSRNCKAAKHWGES